MFVLDVPPDRSGNIREKDKEIILALRKLIKKNEMRNER